MKSHPIPSTSSVPTKELLTQGCEHHEIVDVEGLVMMTAMIPPVWSPKQTPDEPSRGRTGGGGGSVS